VTTSPFDPEELFRELLSRWPSARNTTGVSKVRALFDAIVKDEEWWLQLDAALEDELGKKQPQELGRFLKTYAAANGIQLGPAPAGMVEESAGLPPVETPDVDPAVMAAFRRVWEFWPPNEDFPEKLAKAEDAWQKTARHRDLGVMVDTCKYYARYFGDPTNGMEFPMHLCNFLAKDDYAIFDEWAAKTKAGPTEQDEAEFDAMYAWYPQHRAKDHERHSALLFWRRHIKPEQRFDFFVAVQSYRSERRDSSTVVAEQELYTMGFIRFVGEWRIHMRCQPVGRASVKPLREMFRRLGLDPTDYWFDAESGNPEPALRLAGVSNTKTPPMCPTDTIAHTIKRQLERHHEPRPDLDMMQLTAEVRDEAYKRALLTRPHLVSYPFVHGPGNTGTSSSA
jgi:hypothetical protein